MITRACARREQEGELAGVCRPVLSVFEMCAIATCPSESSKTEAVWQEGGVCVCS